MFVVVIVVVIVVVSAHVNDREEYGVVVFRDQSPGQARHHQLRVYGSYGTPRAACSVASLVLSRTVLVGGDSPFIVVTLNGVPSTLFIVRASSRGEGFAEISSTATNDLVNIFLAP